MHPKDHEKLLKNSITKTYKKAPTKLEKSINLEAKNIAKNINLADRIEHLPRAESLITLKDHKDNFTKNPTCCLINPSKNELGKISKSILERVNRTLVEQLKYNQWKNTNNAIEWFANITNKQNCTFIQFDIKELYPSITEEILDTAITFARNHADINNAELRIIKHCRKSLLFSNKEAWKKKYTDSSFDVTMGSYGGAEICELVGIYTLSKLKNITSKDDIGLYRDDGLILLRELNGQQIDKIRKNIKVFKSIGFQIEIETNLDQVNFLDITFNLRSGTYRPYKKPNDKLLYVHTLSNHPPQIISQLPLSINERLCNNSSNETVFESTKLEYQ